MYDEAFVLYFDWFLYKFILFAGQKQTALVIICIQGEDIPNERYVTYW